MADTAACPVGSANFTSYPAGVRIFMDGMDQGIPTPTIITDVPAGVHSYVLRLAGYKDYPGTVTVLENQTAGVTVNLTSVSNKGLLAGLSLMVGVLGVVIASAWKERPKYNGPRFKCVLKPAAPGQ